MIKIKELKQVHFYDEYFIGMNFPYQITLPSWIASSGLYTEGSYGLVAACSSHYASKVFITHDGKIYQAGSWFDRFSNEDLTLKRILNKEDFKLILKCFILIIYRENKMDLTSVYKTVARVVQGKTPEKFLLNYVNRSYSYHFSNGIKKRLKKTNRFLNLIA